MLCWWRDSEDLCSLPSVYAASRLEWVQIPTQPSAVKPIILKFRLLSILVQMIPRGFAFYTLQVRRSRVSLLQVMSRCHCSYAVSFDIIWSRLDCHRHWACNATFEDYVKHQPCKSNAEYQELSKQRNSKCLHSGSKRENSGVIYTCRW